jgi:histidine triad (HIT) family protein
MQYDENNVFAQIINKKIAADIIYEDDKILAFNDINKASKIHILLIPKQKFISFDDFVSHAAQEDIQYFFQKAQEIAKKFSLNHTGYRIITNHGKDANQTVNHFHIHILGGEKLGGLLTNDSLER